MHVFHTISSDPDIANDLSISITANQLHAPLVERLIELPMDIHEGRISGELHIRCHDDASWEFPEFYGKLNCEAGGAVCVEGVALWLVCWLYHWPVNWGFHQVD